MGWRIDNEAVKCNKFTMSSKTECPLCRRQCRLHHRVEKYTLMRCAGCRHVFLSPLPTAEELKRGYSGEDTGFVENKGDTFNHLENSDTLGTVGSRELLSALQWVPASGKRRLLDIGAGSGKLMRQARELGWDAVGIEPGPWGEEAARKFGLKIHVAMTEELSRSEDLSPSSFDLITLMDVLEHLGNPFEVFKNAAGMLRPGGRIVCQFPCSTSVAYYTRGGKWPLVLPPGHIHYFSQASFQAMAEQAGVILVKEVTTLHTPVLPKARFFPVSVAEALVRPIVEKIGLGDLRLCICTKP